MQNSQDLLERIRNYKPQSSVGMLEAFLESSIHLDFQNELIARIEDMRDYNEENESKQYLETRGGIKAMRLVYTIFKDILRGRQSDLEEEENERR